MVPNHAFTKVASGAPGSSSRGPIAKSGAVQRAWIEAAQWRVCGGCGERRFAFLHIVVRHAARATLTLTGLRLARLSRLDRNLLAVVRKLAIAPSPGYEYREAVRPRSRPSVETSDLEVGFERFRGNELSRDYDRFIPLAPVCRWVALPRTSMKQAQP
jgi:hypothetical protein